jgi:electron transfer flavoprotein beta subunit
MKVRRPSRPVRSTLIRPQAKKKPVEKTTPKDLGVDLSPRLETVKVQEPPKRKGGLKVESVDALVSKLKELGAV